MQALYAGDGQVTGPGGIRLAGLVLLAAALVALAATRAQAQPGLLVGVTDDTFKARPSSAFPAARQLGLGGFRVSLGWAPGQTQMSAGDVAAFNSMVAAANGMRIVVTVYGKADAAPLDSAARDTYCTYVRNMLARYPAINDVVIWNEANLQFFWAPQFNPDGTSAAPAAYEALLARCWDVLHAFRPNVNVITSTSPGGNDNPNAVSNVSHSPGAFIRQMGAAYRASGRTSRIFDTVGHNPYGASSSESPWQQHLGPSLVGEGDLDHLVQALDDGFGGTAQPVPGDCGGAQACPSIWYLEVGYQTVPDAAHQQDYTGRENDARPLLDGTRGTTQSSQLTDGLELAYCQPYVGAFFNFLLVDEPDLARWQSGVLWADGTSKTSFAALRQAVATVAGRQVDCARLAAAHATPLAAASGLIDRIEWPALTAFSVFNEVWSFSIDVRAAVSYHAALVSSRGAQSLTTSGTLARERPRVLQFPAARLRAGTYRIEVVVTSKSHPKLAVTRTSPAFVVE